MAEFKGELQIIARPGEYSFAGVISMPSWDCPLCMKPMLAVIFRCGNKHWICGDCANNSNKKCPNCRDPIREIWYIAMAIRDTLTTKCSNDGCDATMFVGGEDETNHRENCVHQMFSCPRCTMEVSYYNHRDHFNRVCGGKGVRVVYQNEEDISVDIVRMRRHQYNLIIVSTRHIWMYIYVTRVDAGLEFIAVSSRAFDGPIVRWCLDDEDQTVVSKLLRPYSPKRLADRPPKKVIIPEDYLNDNKNIQVSIVGTYLKFRDGDVVNARVGNKNVIGGIKNIVDKESRIIGNLVEVSYVGDSGIDLDTITLSVNDVKKISTNTYANIPRPLQKFVSELVGARTRMGIVGIRRGRLPSISDDGSANRNNHEDDGTDSDSCPIQ